MKRFIVITVCTTVTHAILAVALGIPATLRAEQEIFGGTMPWHTTFRIMGSVSQLLLYPLLFFSPEVYEPLTTLLFIANSVLWGIVIALIWTFVSSKRKS